MERDEVVRLLLEKVSATDWHWLSYHISPYRDGYEHFLSASVVDACFLIEGHIPGFTEEFASRLASLSGKEKYVPHYEQIIQLLSELYVIRHLVSAGGPSGEFCHEPTSGESGKNPEVGMRLGGRQLFVEVKCRQYIEHHNNRGSAAIEVPSRTAGIRELAEEMKGADDSIVLPRDNVVKDFLVSADEKFGGFRKENESVLCVLVIIWDDFIYEPISSLINEASGLLTERSFLQESGRVVRFNNVDAVLVVRQSHHIVRATRDELPVDGLSHPLDWGSKGAVSPKALVPVGDLPPESLEFLCDIFEAHHIDDLQGAAEYRPQQFVINV